MESSFWAVFCHNYCWRCMTLFLYFVICGDVGTMGKKIVENVMLYVFKFFKFAVFSTIRVTANIWNTHTLHDNEIWLKILKPFSQKTVADIVYHRIISWKVSFGIRHIIEIKKIDMKSFVKIAISLELWLEKYEVVFCVLS